MSDGDVRVVPVTRLSDVRALDGELVVVDATALPAPLPLLARTVRLRRVLKAAGGELLLAAGPATSAELHRSGLDRSLPCRPDVTSAVAAIRTALNTAPLLMSPAPCAVQ
ncbi:MAG TPA: hypothetical protein VFH54_07905 [Mycobacteriales bacterium]|nr:hypothetical protein [Mycobacteriales bacterium]